MAASGLPVISWATVHSTMSRAFVPVAASWLVVAVVLGRPATCAADEHVERDDAVEVPLPCRPTIACTAEFVEPGQLEIEAGYTSRRFEAGVQHSTPFLAKLTVIDGLQVQVGSDGYVADPARGAYVDDLLVVSKLRLAKQTPTVPALAVSIGVGAPTIVHHRDAVPTTQAQLVAFASKDILSFHADLNVGVNSLAMGQATAGQPFGALALSRQVGPRFTGMLEGYVFAAATPLASTDHGLLLAASWAAYRELVIDAGADCGMGAQDRRFSLFVGATMLGPRMW